MNIPGVSGLLTLTTVVLSIIGYSAAERFWMLAIVGVPAAVLGWWLTGIRGYRPLGKIVVNALVLAAIGWSAYRVVSTGGGQGLTVSIFSEFLAAILLLKLWDHRQARDTAQILTLSVFLAIGSILTDNSLRVGIVLVANVAVLIAGVMAFHLAAGLERAGPAGIGRGRHIARSLGAVSAGAFAVSLGVSVVVWLVMPRGSGLGQFGSLGEITGGRRTGFTDRVDLRRSGLISESQRTVMELEVESRPASPNEPPENLGAQGRLYYLRGVVLDEYRRGAWTASSGDGTQDHGPVVRDKWIELRQRKPAEIVQTIVVRDAGSGSVPLMCLPDASRFRFDSDVARLIETRGPRTFVREGRPGRFSYSVVSVVPQVPGDREPIVRNTVATFPSEAVHALAAAVLARVDLSDDPNVRLPAEDLTACRAIERYLQMNYSYTLDPPVGAVESDPVESFLLETRSGHCEYFASAMAAMCRSVGIAARVVAGYVAGEYSEEERKYIVRESNAHAWAEAEVAPGIWQMFDPTPQASLQATMHPSKTLLARWTRWMDTLDDAWATSVVSFDAGSRQRLLGAELNPTPVIQDWMYGAARALRRAIERARTDSGGFSLDAVAIVGIAGAVLVAGFGITRALLRWIAALLRRTRQRRSDPHWAVVHAQGEFYDDLLKVLGRIGLPKPAWCSPLDHAESLRARHPALYEPVVTAVRAYYRLRFARAVLTPEELRGAQDAVRSVRRAARRG